MVMEECPKCGSTDIDEGKNSTAPSVGTVNYSSNAQKSFLWVDGQIKIYLCLNCGYLEYYVKNFEQLKKKIKK